MCLLLGGSQEKTALKFEDIQAVVSFLVNYATEQAVQLPGRVPGFKRTDLKV